MQVQTCEPLDFLEATEEYLFQPVGRGGASLQFASSELD